MALINQQNLDPNALAPTPASPANATGGMFGGIVNSAAPTPAVIGRAPAPTTPTPAGGLPAGPKPDANAPQPAPAPAVPKPAQPGLPPPPPTPTTTTTAPTAPKAPPNVGGFTFKPTATTPTTNQSGTQSPASQWKKPGDLGFATRDEMYAAQSKWLADNSKAGFGAGSLWDRSGGHGPASDYYWINGVPYQPNPSAGGALTAVQYWGSGPQPVADASLQGQNIAPTTGPYAGQQTWSMYGQDANWTPAGGWQAGSGQAPAAGGAPASAGGVPPAGGAGAPQQPVPGVPTAPGTPAAPGIVDAAGRAVPPTYDQLNQALQPSLGTVSPDSTVQGQLQSILSSGNPLIEQAKARAMKQAASRGLVNSSIAAQAGEEAMVAQALPIAQQDAQAFFNQAITNQDITNQVLRDKYAVGGKLLEQYESFKQADAMFDKEGALKNILLNTQLSSEEKRAAWQNATTLQAQRLSSETTLSAAELQADTSIRNTDANIAAEIRRQGMVNEFNKYSVDLQANVTRESNLLQANTNVKSSYAQIVANITTSDLTPEGKANALSIVDAIFAGTGVTLP